MVCFDTARNVDYVQDPIDTVDYSEFLTEVTKYVRRLRVRLGDSFGANEERFRFEIGVKRALQFRIDNCRFYSLLYREDGRVVKYSFRKRGIIYRLCSYLVLFERVRTGRASGLESEILKQ